MSRVWDNGRNQHGRTLDVQSLRTHNRHGSTQMTEQIETNENGSPTTIELELNDGWLMIEQGVDEYECSVGLTPETVDKLQKLLAKRES